MNQELLRELTEDILSLYFEKALLKTILFYRLSFREVVNRKLQRMTNEVQKFLDKLGPDFQPLKKQVEKYFDSHSRITPEGTLQVFKCPWVAPLNFGVIIFSPANDDFIDNYKKRTNKTIPGFYSDILRQLNGCFIYGFSLFGLPKSFYANNLLDRSVLQQYDLGTANMHWIHDYKSSKNAFYFGGRTYSYDENIGYFLENNKIFALRENGKIISEWTSLVDFLNDEIDLAEKMMLDKKPL